jgi:hypothetical protein
MIMPCEVFISYSTNDKQIAEAVCHYLEARSIRCWIAPRDVPPGREWADVVVEAIDQCRLVVLVFSSSANDSAIVKKEILLAVNKEIVIIPFRIENVLPVRAMELFISARHWLDAITPPVENHIRKLADTVEGFLSGKNDPAERYDPITAIDAIAERWIADGCPYRTLEAIDQKLQILVREPPDDVAVKQKESLMLLLMLSLHFSGNWAFWVNRNAGNPLAIKQLLAQLNIEYLRPRLRALFALQCYSYDDVAPVLRESGDDITSGSRSLIKKYVITHTVPEYLVKFRDQADAITAGKVSEVLKEIERYWGIKVAGGNTTELPDL